MSDIAERLLRIARASLTPAEVAAIEEYDARLAKGGGDRRLGPEDLISAVKKGSRTAMTAYGLMKYRGLIGEALPATPFPLRDITNTVSRGRTA
jgi:hypothetical protein